jgi:hypothetical protein
MELAISIVVLKPPEAKLIAENQSVGVRQVLENEAG